MGAAVANIPETENFFVGEDRTLRFYVVDDNEAVVDVTGWTMTWQLRGDREDDAAVITKVPSIADAVNGVVDVAIFKTDTLNLRAGRYVHALKRTDTGSSWVLSDGSVILKRSAARE